MPIAKKRGDKYRCQAYNGKDPVTGKNMYKSFTAATKKAAELMTAKYLLQQLDNRQEKNYFVGCHEATYRKKECNHFT